MVAVKEVEEEWRAEAITVVEKAVAALVVEDMVEGEKVVVERAVAVRVVDTMEGVARAVAAMAGGRWRWMQGRRG